MRQVTNRRLGKLSLELQQGAWPRMLFFLHGNSIKNIARWMVKNGRAASVKEVLGDDFYMNDHLIPLSSLGRWQAEQTRDLLKIKPDVVISSNALRAINTTRIVCPGVEFETNDCLKERDRGIPFDDNNRNPLMQIGLQIYKQSGKYYAQRGIGGESYEDIVARLKSFLDNLRYDHSGQTVFIFCHSAVMWLILKIFGRYSVEQLFKIMDNTVLHNCGILEYNSGGIKWNSWEYCVKRQPITKLWPDDQATIDRLTEESIREIPFLREQVKKTLTL